MISGTYCYGRNGNCQLPHGREAQKFESIIQMMGLNMTTAFTVFAIPVVNEGRIPLQLRPIRFGVPRIRRDCVKALLNWN